MDVTGYSDHKNKPEDIVNSIVSKIKERANSITESEYAEEWWDYFNQYELFNI